ncbi:hypothetical protein EKD16_18820 [Streptomonospora litoralis]|uniref:Uncharacterized protein n=1 Tax=Streptomonospora litoralis TaxID=2498135 RepID=A0A4P6Q915_9ACTN|nr:hypothetical protein EKD16_18820 [Streptomonospora litoralis]
MPRPQPQAPRPPRGPVAGAPRETAVRANVPSGPADAAPPSGGPAEPALGGSA